jgi:hypothetical protein
MFPIGRANSTDENTDHIIGQGGLPLGSTGFEDFNHDGIYNNMAASSLKLAFYNLPQQSLNLRPEPYNVISEILY